MPGSFQRTANQGFGCCVSSTRRSPEGPHRRAASKETSILAAPTGRAGEALKSRARAARTDDRSAGAVRAVAVVVSKDRVEIKQIGRGEIGGRPQRSRRAAAPRPPLPDGGRVGSGTDALRPAARGTARSVTAARYSWRAGARARCTFGSLPSGRRVIVETLNGSRTTAGGSPRLISGDRRHHPDNGCPHWPAACSAASETVSSS